MGLVGKAQIRLIHQRRRLQCVVGAFCAHLTMGKAPQSLLDQWTYFCQGSIVPVTPTCSELPHSLLRDRELIHHGLHSLSASKDLCTHKASPRKSQFG